MGSAAATAEVSDLSAPFPYFGGKRSAAPLVWERFGRVRCYIEPFFGSGAVLLSRPGGAHGRETVNDLDGMIANFWRATAADPDAVAREACWPVNELDLHARHSWLIGQREDMTERLRTDPAWYDARIAGWWVWGISCWIGSGWCADTARQLPHLGDNGRGVHAPSRQLPHLGDNGMGVHDTTALLETFRQLSRRLRGVRVCCGDWTRITGRSVMAPAPVGVFLDPPYADTANRTPNLYAKESLAVAHDVRRWAIEHGEDPTMRIALCGYDGEHEMPDGWTVETWRNGTGYSNGSSQGRERIWFSPHCLRARQGVLFG